MCVCVYLSIVIFPPFIHAILFAFDLILLLFRKFRGIEQHTNTYTFRLACVFRVFALFVQRERTLVPGGFSTAQNTQNEHIDHY